MRTHTYESSLALIGTSVPEHLVADAEVPILTGSQAQGDLLIVPILPTDGMDNVTWEPVPDTGIQVVRGEATGNTHWLHRGFDSPGVEWARIDREMFLGAIRIPEGQSALLLHTDEHGSNGIGPGCYAIHGKREQADVIRHVAD